MFCPECKSEYREGFSHCNDCDVDLVAQLPMQSETNDDAGDAGPAVVFVSADANEAALVQSLLEASGIEVTAFDRNLARMDSPVALIIGGVKLAVSPHQEKLAHEVLEEFRGKAGQDPAHGRSTPFTSLRLDEVPDSGDATLEEPYRCVHCHELLEPESTVCSKCGGTPW